MPVLDSILERDTVETGIPIDPGATMLIPDIDEARRAVKQLGGLVPCERSRYRDLLRMIRAAGTEIVPDVVDILRVVSDPEASDLLEGVASELGAPYFSRIRELILDGSKEESFRLRLIRVMAWIAEVSEQDRIDLLREITLDTNQYLRAVAAEVAGTCGLGATFRERLQELCREDKSGWVRECAQEALDELGN